MIGPATGNVLGHATGQRYETSSVHVYYDGVDFLELFGFIRNWFTKEPPFVPFLGFIFQVDQVVVQNPDFNLDSPRLTYVRILLLRAIVGNVYFLVEGNVLKGQLHELFRSSELRQVPHGFGQL